MGALHLCLHLACLNVVDCKVFLKPALANSRITCEEVTFVSYAVHIEIKIYLLGKGCDFRFFYQSSGNAVVNDPVNCRLTILCLRHVVLVAYVLLPLAVEQPGLGHFEHFQIYFLAFNLHFTFVTIFLHFNLRFIPIYLGGNNPFLTLQGSKLLLFLKLRLCLES